jgi:hypothetical protein
MGRNTDFFDFKSVTKNGSKQMPASVSHRPVGLSSGKKLIQLFKMRLFTSFGLA